MPTIDWAFLCDYAFVDASGKASIIGVFENVNAAGLPANYAQMYIALGMKIAPGENFDVSAKISSPTGRELSKINPQKIIIPTNAPGVGKAVVCFGFYRIQFTETGEHHIEVFIDGNSVHLISLNIALRSQAQ